MSGIVTTSLLPEVRTPRQHPEADLQHQVVDYLRWALPADALCFHIPNGGPRHGKARAILAGLGLRAGIPDLCVIHRGYAYFIELKAARGQLSEDQRQMHKKLAYAGAVVLTLKSVPGVECALRELGIPLRARVLA